MDTTYTLTPINRFDTAFSPKGGTVRLPGKGRYLISFFPGPVLDSPFIEIKDTGLFAVRFKEHKIQLYQTGAFDTPPLYATCDSLINGYREDFYPNGNRSIRGNFVKGYIKDSLVTFYPTGKIEKRILRLPKIVRIEAYDSTGYITQISNSQNKSFMTYRENHITTFFPNGKVKSKESDVKRAVRIEEFYPSGRIKIKQTKKWRTEYFDNGIKSITYTWKPYNDGLGIKYGRDFVVNRKEYDENGAILKSSIFECWNQGIQPDLDILKANWLVNSTTYKDGAIVSVRKDVNLDDYRKRYPDDPDHLFP